MKNRLVYALIVVALSLSGCSYDNQIKYDEEDIVGIDRDNKEVVENIVDGEQYVKTVCNKEEVIDLSCSKAGYLTIGNQSVEVDFDDTGDAYGKNDGKAYILTQYGLGKDVIEGKYGEVFLFKIGDLFQVNGDTNHDDISIGDEIDLRVPILQSKGGDYLRYRVVDILPVENYDEEENNEKSDSIKILNDDGQNSRFIVGERIKEE